MQMPQFINWIYRNIAPWERSIAETVLEAEISSAMQFSLIEETLIGN